MPPKPRRGKDDDGDYVPGEEEEEESEEEVVGETSTESPKKSTKTKKPKRRKDDEAYVPTDPEESDEDVETSEQPSPSRQGKKTKKEKQSPSSPDKDDDDDDDDNKKKVSNPVKKITKVLKEKKDEILDVIPSKLQKKASPSPSPSPKNDEETTELDRLLASFPLPSSSRRHVFNPKISLIGSINIQAFGTTKSSNNVIMRIISDILRLYDIVLCQEIRAKDDLIQNLCSTVSTPATPYAYVASHPIGRTTYKEKYVYLYRKNEWKVLDDYVIDDDVKLGDKFIREPYVVRFQNLKKPSVRITLVGCHTQPENAFDEIKTLVDTVYTDVRKKLQRDIVQEKRQLDRGIEPKAGRNKILDFIMRYCCCCCSDSYSSVSTRDFNEELANIQEDGGTNEPIIMMGDLNAAGSYVNKSHRHELDALLKKNNLIWGIQHNADTTVADGPDTAYDRFIFEAANERRWIGNTNVWKFDEGWLKGDTDVTLAKKAAKRVTDHYPIEFELKL